MASDLHADDMPSDRTPNQGLEQLAVAGRVILAAGGGYAIAALATALGALVLPLPRAEAVAAATQASFAVMAGACIVVFAASTLARAAVGLGVTTAILAMGLWWAGGFTAMAQA